MAMFPTKVALKLARMADIHLLTTHPIDLPAAISDFQKVAATGSFDDSLIMIEAHLTNGELSDEQVQSLEQIYEFTKIEVNGIIVNSIGSIMDDSDVESNRLHAAKLLHAIQNGEDGGNLKDSIKKITFELEK